MLSRTHSRYPSLLQLSFAPFVLQLASESDTPSYVFLGYALCYTAVSQCHRFEYYTKSLQK
ncbi:unnamed protein product [Ixodes pacificus]